LPKTAAASYRAGQKAKTGDADDEGLAMKYVDEFRDPAKARILTAEIRRLVERIPRARERKLQIMEVCGGHTHTIFRYGIQQLLPDEVEFVHGPGCPVCVLPMGRVDDCVALAERPEVIFATFGDAMRVPGSRKSLLKAKAEGADVRMVYSPLDALKLARSHPEREVIFFGLGFETTMPSTAMTVLEARRQGIRNFSLFCNHITIIPTIKAILDSPDLQLDGFLGPGHVSMVIGTRPYEFIARHYRKPIAIAGFEPLDLLQALWMVLRQLAEGRCEVENQYGRVVAGRGNPAALAAIREVFELRPFFEWRGLGSIDHSGVRIRDAYAEFDAERRFGVPNVRIADPKSCQCGEVLTGIIKPRDCKVFGTACTPQTPLGSLMVSSEGACAAYYSFGRIDTLPASARERRDAVRSASA
jgi:hydrogenase expression/formation protein HypD